MMIKKVKMHCRKGFKPHQFTFINGNAIITLQRIFEIVQVLNFTSSPVIIQMIPLIFVHNPLFIYKMQFLLTKPVLSASRYNGNSSKIIKLTSYGQVHCDQIFVNNLPQRICRAITMHFCIQLNTFIRLGISNSVIFVIFPCCFIM